MQSLVGRCFCLVVIGVWAVVAPHARADTWDLKTDFPADFQEAEAFASDDSLLINGVWTYASSAGGQNPLQLDGAQFVRMDEVRTGDFNLLALAQDSSSSLLIGIDDGFGRTPFIQPETASVPWVGWVAPASGTYQVDAQWNRPADDTGSATAYLRHDQGAGIDLVLVQQGLSHATGEIFDYSDQVTVAEGDVLWLGLDPGGNAESDGTRVMFTVSTVSAPEPAAFALLAAAFVFRTASHRRSRRVRGAAG